MNVTVRRDLRTVADCTREINRLTKILESTHPTVSPVQRLIHTSAKQDALLRRSRMRAELAEGAEGARAARLSAGSRADALEAETMGRQYKRLSRRSRP